MSPPNYYYRPQPEFSNRDLPRFVTRLSEEVFSHENARKALLTHFSTTTLKPFGLDDSPLAVSAAGAIISYLRQTQFGTAEHLTRLTSYDFREYMLSRNTLRSLEIFQANPARLLSIMDAQNADGSRPLRRWLRQLY